MSFEPSVKLIDLSQPVFDNCPHCPDDPAVRSELISDHEKTGWRVEQLTITPHAGSHVDAPFHRLKGGPAIDSFPLDRFVGKAFIVDYRDARPGQPFTSSMLTRTLRGQQDLADSFVLLATGWGERRAQDETWLKRSPFLSPDGAEWLVEQEVRGVGIDHFSIGGTVEPTNTLTHEHLLEANTLIVEDLYFPKEVFDLPQPVEFWALPINLKGHSGAFCRPVLKV